MPPDLAAQGTLILRPSRSGIYASAFAALFFGAVGIGMVVSGRATGFIVLAIGAVGLFAFLAGVLPGRAFLRLDPQGFYVKAPTKSWGAAWVEVERFRIEARRVGRNNAVMDVVRADYLDGFEGQHTPGSRLGEALGVDERYVMPGYGGLSAGQLVELLEEWRAAVRWTDYTPARRLIASGPPASLVVDQDQARPGGPDA